jgi:hypothetical protein
MGHAAKCPTFLDDLDKNGVDLVPNTTTHINIIRRLLNLIGNTNFQFSLKSQLNFVLRTYKNKEL